MGIPLDKAELLALFLESFFYGIFFTLFWVMLLVLLRRGDAGRVQRRMLIPVGIMILLLATTHLTIDFVRVLQAFIFESEGPLKYYLNISHPLHVAKTCCYVTQTLLGDMVIVWRLFVVYNRNRYVVIVPILGLIVDAFLGYYITYTFSQASPTSDIFQYSSNFIKVFFVVTMGINTICTAAIAYRIYAPSRGLDMPSTLLPVTIAIIESGALYTTAMLSLLIAYVSHSNGKYVALDIVAPLIGIVFALIVLQIHFHLGVRSTFNSNTSNGGDSANRLKRTGADDPIFAMHVHVTEESQVGYPGIDRRSDLTSTWISDEVKTKSEV